MTTDKPVLGGPDPPLRSFFFSAFGPDAGLNSNEFHVHMYAPQLQADSPPAPRTGRQLVSPRGVSGERAIRKNSTHRPPPHTQLRSARRFRPSGSALRSSSASQPSTPAPKFEAACGRVLLCASSAAPAPSASSAPPQPITPRRYASPLSAIRKLCTETRPLGSSVLARS